MTMNYIANEHYTCKVLYGHLCPTFLSISLLNIMTKINWGKKGFIWLVCPDHSTSWEVKVPAQEKEE